ncbi:MAG: hypothetical protein K2Q01_06620, partial [Rickettsiales bacterium]|nr:hypothetical protein [Rickettsiales bacterium]
LRALLVKKDDAHPTGGFKDADELLAKLADIKNRYESGFKGRGNGERRHPQDEAEVVHYHFPQLKDKNGAFTRYSQLDALYVQALNAGDCYPKIEMRQNATMHRNVLKHIMKLCTRPENKHLKISNQPQEYIEAVDALNGGGQLTTEKIDHASNVAFQAIPDLAGLAKINGNFGKMVRDKVAEYEPEVKAYYKLDPKAREERLKDKDFKERLDYYETLKGWELTTKYPNAIKSYVIAETGVIHEEEKIVAGWDPGKRRTYVANRSANDLLTSIMFKYLVTPVSERNEKPDMKMTQIIPLMENREAIIAAEAMFNRLYSNDLFVNYIKRSHYSDVPQMFVADDGGAKGPNGVQGKGSYKPVTTVQARHMLGMDPIPNDQDTAIRGVICAKFAGSDSMRENGVCIGPLNAHNQERVAAMGLMRGFLVETDQGVGGAVHRSNPGAFTVARGTFGQGAANHYFTPEAIANRAESHHAAHMMQRAGYSMSDYHVHHKGKDGQPETDVHYNVSLQKYRDIAAGVPGHLGNALLLPLENDKLREETFGPLYEGTLSHAKMFENKSYDKFIENASGLDFTKWFNYSARPAARVGVEFSASSLRAIGYNLSLFTMGTNLTLFKGLDKFMGLNIETGEFDKERTQRFMRESPKIQDMMTRAAFGIALADYDIAWKFQGAKRVASASGEVSIQFGDKEVSLAKLAQGNKPKGFTDDMVTLAKMDLEYQAVGKAVLETYRDMQFNGKAPAMSPNFKPEQILRIMPPEMRAEVADMRKTLTKARTILAEARNSEFMTRFKEAPKEEQKKMEKAPEYLAMDNAYRAVAETLESGTHESLNRISRTFNNKFVLQALEAMDKKQGLHKAVAGDAQYQLAS